MTVLIKDKYGYDVSVGDYVLTPIMANNTWGEVMVAKVLRKTPYGVELEGVSTKVKTPSRITLVSKRFAELWESGDLRLV